MFLALLPLLLAGANPVAATAVPAAPGAVASKPKPAKKICKRDEATESRMGSKRICKTAAEWRSDSLNSVEEIDGNKSGKMRSR